MCGEPIATLHQTSVHLRMDNSYRDIFNMKKPISVRKDALNRTVSITKQMFARDLARDLLDYVGPRRVAAHVNESLIFRFPFAELESM